MTEKRAPKRLALIIASYEYQDDSLRQLVAPAQDAEALARVLKDPDIGGFDEVKVLTNRPSHEVRVEIASFFADRKRDDLLLLYFSGHGVKDDDGQLYLATTDTQRQLDGRHQVDPPETAMVLHVFEPPLECSAIVLNPIMPVQPAVFRRLLIDIQAGHVDL